MKTGLLVESTGRNTRLVSGGGSRPQDLVLPSDQRQLLIKWLKRGPDRASWAILLKLSTSLLDQPGVEAAEALAQALLDTGLAKVDQKLEHTIWRNRWLSWVDHEALCQSQGVESRLSRSNAFFDEWQAARDNSWQSAALSKSFDKLPELPADTALHRLRILLRLDSWLQQGKSGSRRDFSLHAFGQTKHELSSADWTWLDSGIGLASCGIHQHSSGLWLAGELELLFGERMIDFGAAGDALAIPESALYRATAARGRFKHFRVVENRTSFERLARSSDSDRLVVWLPGYASARWMEAVDRLLALIARPLRISCDADPDGVQIALRAARLWHERGLSWDPDEMDAVTAAKSAHHLHMSERDRDLAHRLLQDPILHPGLHELLRWCLKTGCKAEQENWLS